MKKALAIGVCVALVGCMPTVRQSDLQAWVGQPVSALDTQPFFVTVPMTRTMAADGTEVRNYNSTKVVTSCSGGGMVYSGLPNLATATSDTDCVSERVGCNNLFFIRDGKVLRYEPTGQCRTDDRVLPRASI
jgi:hypothetical protein